MTDLAIRQYHNNAREFDKDCVTARIGAVVMTWGGIGSSAFFMLMGNLLNQAISEIDQTTFKSQEKKDAMMAGMKAGHEHLIESILGRMNTSTQGNIFDGAVLARIEGYADQLEEKDTGSIPVNRETMDTETDIFLKDLNGWDIPDYVKSAMNIKMGALKRMIHATSIYSDNALRARVKEIVADFAAEFAAFDKDFQKYLERVVEWARKAALPAVFMLGLTADVSAVVALIENHPLMIGSS